MDKRVVVTGMGIWSCLGTDVDTVKQSLFNGVSGIGNGISQPSDEGCHAAMSRAIASAGLTAKEIDYVNAHATSTPQGDMYEAKALSRLFAGKRTIISSTKSMTGHECWMAGASETVYSIIMMQNDFVAPNINLENPDECAKGLNITSKTMTGIKINTILNNSFGFGGTNSALIISKI